MGSFVRLSGLRLADSFDLLGSANTTALVPLNLTSSVSILNLQQMGLSLTYSSGEAFTVYPSAGGVTFGSSLGNVSLMAGSRLASLWDTTGSLTTAGSINVNGNLGSFSGRMTVGGTSDSISSTDNTASVVLAGGLSVAKTGQFGNLNVGGTNVATALSILNQTSSSLAGSIASLAISAEAIAAALNGTQDPSLILRGGLLVGSNIEVPGILTVDGTNVGAALLSLQVSPVNNTFRLVDSLSPTSSFMGPGVVPGWSGSYTAGGGTVSVEADFTAYATMQGLRQFSLLRNGVAVDTRKLYFDFSGQHLPSGRLLAVLPAETGTNTYSVTIDGSTVVDGNDTCSISITELGMEGSLSSISRIFASTTDAMSSTGPAAAVFAGGIAVAKSIDVGTSVNCSSATVGGMLSLAGASVTFNSTTPTVQSQVLGGLYANGAYLSNTGPGASLYVYATETWSSTAQGTALAMYLTKTGTLTNSNIITFYGDQVVSSVPFYAPAFNLSSDRGLKTNIRDLSYDDHDFASIRPVSFSWKESGKKDLGFIAQDLASVLPEAESNDHINLTPIVALLVKRVQELERLCIKFRTAPALAKSFL